MTLVLGIETSCDETAAAVVADGRHVLSNLVAAQFDLHAKYGGVVPELAARAHIERLDLLIRAAMSQAGVAPAQLDAIAVTARPGLIGALLIGVTAAKTLAWAWGKPLIDVDHIQAHAVSAALGESGRQTEVRDQPAERVGWASPAAAAGDDDPGEATRGEFPQSAIVNPPSPLWPAVALVVSGGHTSLFLVRRPVDIERLGHTIDDAAGEAFDKVAMILGLGYPGGPVVDRRAAGGDPERVALPRTMLAPGSLDFSFSGLKTAVLYHVHGPGRTTGGLGRFSPADIDDICASFSAAVVDVLVAKTLLAVEKAGVRSVVVGGGVAANSMLRQRLAAACEQRRLTLRLTPMQYCTDNAAMIAALGYHRFMAGHRAELSLTAQAS